MTARTQQSFFRPAVAAIPEAATTPDPGTVNALALSSITLGLMRWTGTQWVSLGAVRNVQAYVDFGHATGGQETNATVTVAAPWVTATSVIICTPAGMDTADHGPEDAALEELQLYVTNRVAGVGFDITATAPNGTWGRHLVTATG